MLCLADDTSVLGIVKNPKEKENVQADLKEMIKVRVKTTRNLTNQNVITKIWETGSL